MKKLMIILILIGVNTTRLPAQSEESKQLLLNVEKLVQFKKILSNMKKGYQVLNTGYSRIKDLSQGNFTLHKNFLDGLLTISPMVRKYKRVADIISDQVMIVKEYKSSFNRFKQDGNFDPLEIDYLGQVYNSLFEKSLNDLDELTMVLTDSKLRMSDDERLESIDRIYASMQDKLQFLRHFNNNATILAVQKAREKNYAATMKKIYGITN